MHLTAGTRLGPYEVLSPLGAGGMGEVYRARDSRLGRDVAIKVLPQHLRENAEVHARFEREARTISSLNHPHICTLHDVGREGDVEYLVMELVDGETLAQRIAKGPLPVPEALKLGIQIADALDRAHRAGIVHRDFKPGNVMLTRSGAKLMDFGLARASGVTGTTGGSGSGSAFPHLTQSPTVASPLTAEGAIVGTFLYMSPEQLEGRETDVRSDLWALGCVLYETVTGRRAFEGRTQASLIGAIMGTEPPAMSTLVPLAPPALEALVRGLLAKDPEERIQTAHDVKLQLTWIAQSGSQSGVAAPLPPRRRSRREPLAWGVAVVAALAAAFFAWRTGGDGAATADAIRFTVPVPPSVSTMSMPRVSPDGRFIAFSAEDSAGRTMVWVRPLNALAANVLPGTEGAAAPFWSPDSRFLGFIAGGKLKKIAISGGPATVVCDAPTGSDGSWGKGDVILFDGGGADPILRVSAAGGVPSVAIAGDSIAQVGWPAFLPDGRHFFFSHIGANGASEIMLGALGDTASRRLEMAGSRVEYSPDGHLMFARDRTLLAQRFDARAMKLRGEPFPVAEDLPVANNALANFTVSRNGVLVYRSTGEVQNRLVWLDRTGRELAEIAPAADFRAPALSPNADRVAVRLREANSANLDLRVMDLARGTSTRFTFDPVPDGNPVWSPDGASIAWTTSAGDSDIVAVRSATGLGQPRIVARHLGGTAVLDWSRDGRWILYQGITAGSAMDVYAVPAAGDASPERILGTPFAEGRARFSPDARWIVYESNESGRAEVYVIPFRGTSGKWQVSTRGGSDPFWSRDGREIFYLSPERQLMSVPVTHGGTFVPGTPQPLFRVQVEASPRRNVYDVAPDGKRFLFLLTAGEASTPMTVVVNWRAAQGKR